MRYRCYGCGGEFASPVRVGPVITQRVAEHAIYHLGDSEVGDLDVLAAARDPDSYLVGDRSGSLDDEPHPVKHHVRGLDHDCIGICGGERAGVKFPASLNQSTG